jgi:pimeloyl-ACP methyl ester carboxylesterase
MTAKLNILLVHGAWGDGSHWRHVIPSLHAKGYRVRAVQNPLTMKAKKTITLQASHASLASQGQEIVGLIELAAASVM